jgi:hypothetical protein
MVISKKLARLIKMENERRAQRALNAIRAGGYEADEDLETGIQDLLTDIRHLCNLQTLPYLDLQDMANNHFLCEIEEFI